MDRMRMDRDGWVWISLGQIVGDYMGIFQVGVLQDVLTILPIIVIGPMDAGLHRRLDSTGEVSGSHPIHSQINIRLHPYLTIPARQLQVFVEKIQALNYYMLYLRSDSDGVLSWVFGCMVEGGKIDRQVLSL